MRYIRNAVLFPIYRAVPAPIAPRYLLTLAAFPGRASPVSALVAARGGPSPLSTRTTLSTGQVQRKGPRQTSAEISMSSRSQLVYLVTQMVILRHGARPV